jgi:predicted DNA-binding protein (MmcQ/YjbR family)
MDAEQFRSLALALPHVEETRQWGDNLVYWVGDKAIGGKMFALLNLDDQGSASVSSASTTRHALVLSLSVGPEHYHELLEQEAIVPAPYMARIHWIALEHWNALPLTELKLLIQNAHALTCKKLPTRVKTLLTLPPKEYRKAVTAKRLALSQKLRAK